MKSQVERLWTLLSDGKPHRTDQILRKVYGSDQLSIARIAARIWDIKKKYPDLHIKGWHDKKIASLYWYQVIFPVKHPARRVPRKAMATV